MAEKREIIIEIEVDNNAAQKNLERTTSQLRTLQTERKELNAQVKKGDADLKREGTTRKAVNKQIVENGLATKRLSDEKRKATKEVNLENNSLNALRNNLSKLTTQRNNVNTGTKEGTKKFKELNKEIANQNKQISKLEQTGGDFRRNVGNYGSAIDGVLPSFAGLRAGIIGATQAAIAFIATPLGLVLAALGLALGAVAQYFTRTEEGAEKLRVVTAFLTTAFNVLLDATAHLGAAIVGVFDNPQKAIKDLGNTLQSFVMDRVDALLDGIGLLGSAIKKVFKGDFEGALEDAGEGAKKLYLEANPITALLIEVGEAGVDAFTSIAKEALVAADAAGVLEGQLISIEKQENDLILTRAKGNKQIAELRSIAEDRTKSELERIEAIKQASAIEEGLVAKEISIAQQRAKIILDQNLLTLSQEEDRKKGIEALAKVEELQQRSFNLQKSLISRLSGIKKEAEAVQNKIDADNDSRSKKQEESRQKEIDAAIELQEFKQSLRVFDLEKELELENIRKERLLENKELTASEILLIEEQSTANANALKKQEVDFAKAQEKQKVQATQDALGAISQTFGNLAQFNKSFAVAQAVIDGISGVQRTLASVPFPFNVPLAATQGAISLKNINDIRSQKTPKFANGGMVEGASHANGGVKFAVGGRVNELEGGEAVINKRSTKMFAPVLSAMNVAGGGVKFANGGVTGFGSASGIDSEISGQNQIKSYINSLPSPIVRVTDINDTQNTVQVTQDTASL